jgi:hypothetical protein
MSGPIGIAIVGLIIFVLWKYWEHVKKAAVVVGKAMKSNSSSRNSSDKDEKERSIKTWWTIVLILIGVMIFFWKIYTPGLQPSQVGSWSWDHWTWLLAFCGILITLVRIHAKSLGTLTDKLQTMVITAILVMFLGFPVWFGVKDSLLPQVICKDASSLETRSCTLNTKWSNWIKAAEGPADNGMQMCFTTGVEFERREDMNGTTFFRFKSKGGRIVVSYRLIPGNQKCPETLP